MTVSVRWVLRKYGMTSAATVGSRALEAISREARRISWAKSAREQLEKCLVIAAAVFGRA
jgi:hypothetical protein